MDLQELGRRLLKSMYLAQKDN